MRSRVRRRKYGRRKRAVRRLAKVKRRMSLVRARRGIRRKFRRRRISRLKFNNVFTPLRRLVKLRYQQTIIPGSNCFDAAGAPIALEHYWRCNQLNCPSGNVAPGGYPNHQPMLYDQLGLFYQRNAVLGCKLHLQLRFYNQNNQPISDYPSFIIILYRSETGIIPTFATVDHLFEMARIDPNIRVYEFKPSGTNVGNTFNFFHTWSIRKQASVKDVRDSLDDYGAVFNNTLNNATSIPAKPWFFGIRMFARGGVVANSDQYFRVEHVVRLNYIALCYERNNLIAQS